MLPPFPHTNRIPPFWRLSAMVKYDRPSDGAVARSSEWRVTSSLSALSAAGQRSRTSRSTSSNDVVQLRLDGRAGRRLSEDRLFCALTNPSPCQMPPDAPASPQAGRRQKRLAITIPGRWYPTCIPTTTAERPQTCLRPQTGRVVIPWAPSRSPQSHSTTRLISETMLS